MKECVGDEKDDKNNRIDNEIEATFPDVTPPDIMHGYVGEEKDDNDENIDDEKEAECPDLTPPVDMEEGVGLKKMIRMIEKTSKKVKVKQQIL